MSLANCCIPIDCFKNKKNNIEINTETERKNNKYYILLKQLTDFDLMKKNQNGKNVIEDNIVNLLTNKKSPKHYEFFVIKDDFFNDKFYFLSNNNNNIIYLNDQKDEFIRYSLSDKCYTKKKNFLYNLQIYILKYSLKKASFIKYHFQQKKKINNLLDKKTQELQCSNCKKFDSIVSISKKNNIILCKNCKK